ncbi:nucleotidyltransferase [Xanthomonas hydrangeae]|uniref:Nucleotidyltransferase n=1 Tax=Xanthomonas hydrangeae TaxID=2775159 RepID=A0AAU0BE03_9XANT|nr:nucleotidyltransferase [Xanthomonas hydrangeae]WOB51314.1 nucleotidyltransferase [Xanthomonas hydrangeae]
MSQISEYESKIGSWEYFLLRAARTISLTEAQYETINARYKVLQGILNAAASPLLGNAHIFVQGSIGLRTTIKPISGAPEDLGTVDADAIVWLPNADGASAESVLAEIYDRIEEGTRVDADVKLLRRGVRIIYADENPGFHIDVTPARAISGNSEENGQGKLEVPDRELMAWKASSPIPYLGWLEAASKKEIALESVAVLAKKALAMDSATQAPLPEYDQYIDNDPLRATIKLLKRHRDEWAIRNKDFSHRPISAVITTLATRAYEDVAADSSNRPRRPLDAIVEIVANMSEYIRYENGEYLICNPEDNAENFAEKWNREDEGRLYVSAFHKWHADAKESISIGLQEFPSAESFNDAINERFALGSTFVTMINNDIPGNWTMPGRKIGHTRNIATIGSVFGSSVSGSQSQDGVRSLERLG